MDAHMRRVAKSVSRGVIRGDIEISLWVEVLGILEETFEQGDGWVMSDLFNE